MAISKYSTLFSHFHGSTTVLQSLATAINYQRICRLISTHANNHQLMWGQSTVIRVTFRVKNPPFFKAQNQKWKLWPQFHIFITYLMKSATSTKVSYINKMDMCPSNHKMNAINNLAIHKNNYTNMRFQLISKSSMRICPLSLVFLYVTYIKYAIIMFHLITSKTKYLFKPSVISLSDWL